MRRADRNLAAVEEGEGAVGPPQAEGTGRTDAEDGSGLVAGGDLASAQGVDGGPVLDQLPAGPAREEVLHGLADDNGHLVSEPAEGDRLAGGGLQGGRDRLQFLRELVCGKIPIQAEPEDEVTGLFGVDTRLGEHAGEFAVMDKEVVGPLDENGEGELVAQEMTKPETEKEGDGLKPGWGEGGTKPGGEVEIAVRRAVPAPAPAPATGGLFRGDDEEGGLRCGGELCLRDGVGAAGGAEGTDCSEKRDGRLGKKSGEKSGMKAIGFLVEPVAAVSHGVEDKALPAQGFHELVDIDARKAQFARDALSGKKAASGAQENAQEFRYRFHWPLSQSSPISDHRAWCTVAPVERKSAPAQA